MGGPAASAWTGCGAGPEEIAVAGAGAGFLALAAFRGLFRALFLRRNIKRLIQYFAFWYNKVNLHEHNTRCSVHIIRVGAFNAKIGKIVAEIGGWGSASAMCRCWPLHVVGGHGGDWHAFIPQLCVRHNMSNLNFNNIVKLCRSLCL